MSTTKPLSLPDGTGPSTVQVLQWAPGERIDRPLEWTSTVASGRLDMASKVVLSTYWHRQPSRSWARLLVAAVAQVLRAKVFPADILAMKASQPVVDLDSALLGLGRMVVAWRADIAPRLKAMERVRAAVEARGLDVNRVKGAFARRYECDMNDGSAGQLEEFAEWLEGGGDVDG